MSAARARCWRCGRRVPLTEAEPRGVYRAHGRWSEDLGLWLPCPAGELGEAPLADTLGILTDSAYRDAGCMPTQ